jgi:hypothetical protein
VQGGEEMRRLRRERRRQRRHVGDLLKRQGRQLGLLGLAALGPDRPDAAAGQRLQRDRVVAAALEGGQGRGGQCQGRRSDAAAGLVVDQGEGAVAGVGPQAGLALPQQHGDRLRAGRRPVEAAPQRLAEEERHAALNRDHRVSSGR